MSAPNRRDIEQWLNRLESEENDVDRVRIPPAQAKRIEQAFEAVDEPIDPERVADLFVYRPDGREMTDDEASAFRKVSWREEFGTEPPFGDNDDGGDP